MAFAELIPAHLPDTEKVGARVVAEWLGVTVTTVKAWAKEGRLPQPHRLGPRKSYFLIGELRVALRKLEEPKATTKRR